ncbi:fumarylacetoacetate hydrolase family protein [Ramlibacter sp. AN1133]|uniref:fumarylacetoacetate hydrolase family protein n=1 Tax=Ramlibacter sp. AN1133 TaxID=3133429 RepID=UPI0030C0F2B2
MKLPLSLKPEDVLPHDGYAGTLVGRVWLDDVGGPAVVVIRESGVQDISAHAPTMASLLELPSPAQAVRAMTGPRLGSLAEVLPRLLAPCDLQVVKASGVTFASSLLERVIEERAGGDLRRAESIRADVEKAVGGDLRAIKPGSPGAQELKALLIRQGMWSQYLEVGIGPDAEVFTKVPVLSSVGAGAAIGIHPKSEWNNPEPEVVLAVNSRGEVQGAALGNDVNLRDFEGRSALLLSKAKDNTASCAIGPFIRLFDDTFTLDDLRREDIELLVEGRDGFVLHGASTMREISRDPLELVAQTLNANHQYPDGFMLFLGTLFAPTQDRGAPGLGFTHHVGDLVTIRSARLGGLRNVVDTSDRVAPWQFGLRALFTNLAARGLLARAL